MFLSELFSEDAEILPKANRVTLDELTGVPQKALPILTRLAKFHQVRDLAFNYHDKVWTATDSAGVEPFLRDAKHITSAAGMGTRMMHEENPNQQISLYNPNGKTYRQQPMPSDDPDDIFSKGNAVSLDDEQYDEIADINNPFEKDPIEAAQLKTTIEQNLSTLSPKQQMILKMRFWKGMTLEEVAKALGVTYERIRQLEAKAMRQLRAIKNTSGKHPLQSFLNTEYE